MATASVFLSGESHGSRSLAGYKVHKVIKSWNTIEATLHAYVRNFYTHWENKNIYETSFIVVVWNLMLHVWGVPEVEGISRWTSFGFLSSVSTCSLDLLQTEAPQTKIYTFRGEWNPFPSSLSGERERKEQWHFCTPWVVTQLKLHLRESGKTISMRTSQDEGKSTEWWWSWSRKRLAVNKQLNISHRHWKPPDLAIWGLKWDAFSSSQH